MVRALVIRAPGTNCDGEMVRAFELAGARADLVHVDRLIDEPGAVERYDLIGFPGGFSYGDDIASGRVLAVKMREHLYPALQAAASAGVLMIGACNGFQVLVQAGLLPGPGESAALPWPTTPPAQSLALTHNAGGRFIDRWVRVVPEPSSTCIWTRGLSAAFASDAEDVMRLPIAHGEGRLVARSDADIESLERSGRVALRYGEPVNGSVNDIAGVCDASGRIFGLMPHPERYLNWHMHPYWTRLTKRITSGPTPGLAMFQSAVRAVQRVPA